MINSKFTFPLLNVLLFAALSCPVNAGTIVTSKHNLSVSGPGTIKSTNESQICIFCHTPHNASPQAPLWNRSNLGNAYTPYTSTSIFALPGQPTGASLLCLSCHDGTIALGELINKTDTISMSGGVTTMPVGSTRLGTDLSDDHPVSFAYTSALATQRGELVNPSVLTGSVHLDASGQMQCTTCHNPHDNAFGKFLVKSNTGSGICTTCHTKNFWSQSAHSTSSASWNGIGTNPWPNSTLTTVSANACLNCHKPHNAGGKQRLLNSAIEENNCSACHSGNVASQDIMQVFNKFSHHPITNTTGVHDFRESAVVGSARHVECYDCHNPHAANTSTGTLNGALTGARGVNASGAEVNPVTAEYQICYRCHSNSPNQAPPTTARVEPHTNVSQQFATTNQSYHPVVGLGKNNNVPSLTAGLNTTSTIKCTSCHNNDSGTPQGPHGSNFAHLLTRQNLSTDPTTESAASYALCYGCHDRNSILGNNSFPCHQWHITGAGPWGMMGGGGGGVGGGGGGGGGALSTPCIVCHDPHGVSGTPKLINFNTAIVSPSGTTGQTRYTSTGTNHGNCQLTCHGRNHNGTTTGVY